jgi:hypothetical protein
MKIRLTFILIILAYLPLSSCKKDNATGPTILSSKLFGGTQYDCGTDIITTKDGGIAMLGSVISADGDVSSNKGGFDFWLLKMDGNGSKSWEKSFGGSLYDWGNAIVQSSDGDYVMAGYTMSNDGDVTGNHGAGTSDAWIVQTDENGNQGWKFIWGGSAEDNATDIIATSDGGYIVCGYTLSTDGDLPATVIGSDGFILKLNSSGIKQWQKILGSSGADRLYSLAKTEDGCYIASGYTTSTDGIYSSNHGGYDGWIVKIDESGTVKWQKLLGTASNESFVSVISTPDGGFAATGSFCNSSLAADSYDILVVKMDSTGTEEWHRTIGGSSYDTGSSATLTSTGSMIITGVTISSDIEAGDVRGNYDILVFSLGMDETISWQKRYGGSGNDNSSAVVQQPAGTIALAGFSSSGDGNLSGNHGLADCWILRLSE